MVAFGGRLDGFFLVAVDDFCTFGFIHIGFDAFQDGIGHVPHLDQKTNHQAGVGKLFGAVHGGETVGQVVVFDGTVLLDLAVAAVVIGDQQSLVGDQFAGAAAAEADDGIFQAGLVDGVEVLGGEPEPFGLHVFDTALFD